jgi:hypothetical protein
MAPPDPEKDRSRDNPDRRSGPVEWQNDGSSTQGDQDMETDRQERSSESRNEG